MCCGLRVCQLKAHQASGNPHEGRPLPLSLIHQAPRPRSRGAEPHTRLTTAPPIACLLAWLGLVCGPMGDMYNVVLFGSFVMFSYVDQLHLHNQYPWAAFVSLRR